MSNWNKKAVTGQQITPLCNKYNIDQILASILVRRGVTQGEDILYYLEKDLRFQHNPFLLNSMEDAVERITAAKEEQEKILIFGDSDVDGVTSTAILYEYLHNNGYDVQWRLPLADDAYGLSINAIDEFAAQGGTLIITVDCGISNNEEIKHANDLGIDVIVTDHHNPPENLPEAIIIVDPKIEDCGYPFPHISGAAVAYKLVSALRFASTEFYNLEFCLFNISEDVQNKCYNIDCLKLRNLIPVKELHEKIIPGKTSIYDLKLSYFLQGQIIYVWNATETKQLLNDIFGSGIEFALNDLQSEVCKIMPGLRGKKSQDLINLSTIAKYKDNENTVISALYNLYVTYTNKTVAQLKENIREAEHKDLQLVALAALADIMPMKNENRIFVNNGLSIIKKEMPRPGLAELFTKLNIEKEAITSIDLSWTVIPALNAAGRLGKSNIALELLISEDAKERVRLAEEIVNLNEERKRLVADAQFKIQDEAKENYLANNQKLCVIINDCINSGVTGIVAARFMQEYNVPCIAVTSCDNVCIGSMRSCRGLIATQFLDSFGDFFINHGGHDYAAGFSFEKSKIQEFTSIISSKIPDITLQEDDGTIDVDAELPPEYLKPEVFKLLDIFEPYGAENGELLFMSRNIKVIDGMKVGKKEPQHLKLVFECGQYKFPAMYWGNGDKWGKEIAINQKCDILFTLSRNYFNKTFSNQLIIKELKLNN